MTAPATPVPGGGTGPVVLDRVGTGRGELVLRAFAGRYEIISNGVFLMDTADGASERALVDAAVARCAVPAPRLLIGGLGVGFSLLRAVGHRHLAAIEVVEIEPALIGWHRTHLRHLTAAALADPRVRVIEADILDWLAGSVPDPDGTGATAGYDAICLDTDNGPNWLVSPDNADLYAARGLDLAAARLRPGGVLAVWSASPDDGYRQRLARHVGPVEVLAVPHRRGEPDLVYLARRDPAGPAGG